MHTLIRPLKHWIQYTTLVPTQTRQRLLSSTHEQMYRALEQSPHTLLSEFPEFLSGEKQLDVPVYTVWGACEDVAIIEKFRSKEYQVQNLFLLDEASTHVLDIGGVSLRLFGLGGAVVQHKLFDNGEGKAISARCLNRKHLYLEKKNLKKQAQIQLLVV
jgi:hypothetical protein